MRSLRRLPVILACLTTTLPAQQKPAPQTIPNPPHETPAAVAQYIRYSTAKNTIYLEHVRVIDGTGAAPIDKATVVLQDGKIFQVIPETQGIPGTLGDALPTLRIDLTGHTVFPGLVGMHDHMYYIARPDLDAQGHSEAPLVVPQMTFTSPHLYLGAGVTTLRTTGSVEPYTDLNLRQQIDAGELGRPARRRHRALPRRPALALHPDAPAQGRRRRPPHRRLLG